MGNHDPYSDNTQDRRFIDEGRMPEDVWPRLSRAEQRKIERFAVQ